ncbi:hypothetical protein PINS_up010533 [Pythium insidiosum]|nr:hypothetical protein PINS_up010533 [Pythium insidiosum]
MRAMSVAPPQDAVLQGYLHKRSKHLKVWKVRYFLLTRTDLLYAKKSGKKLKLCISLDNVRVIDDQNAVEHLGNFVIELRAPTRRVYLSATTEQDRTAWVMALRSLQQDSSHHSTTGLASSTTSGLLQRPVSDSALSSLQLNTAGRLRRHSKRKRASKSRKDERRRRRLPKLKKSFTDVWLEDMLQHHEQDGMIILEALCFAGVPKELRGRVWSWILGNKLQINEELFTICKARAQAVQQEMQLKKEADSVFIPPVAPAGSTTSASSGENSSGVRDSDEQPAKSAVVDTALEEEMRRVNILHDAVGVAEKLVSHGERSIRLVGVDMPRTFGHHPLFQTGADGTTRTTEVLEAYICYRPDLGYVQGMSYLAATLCFHMDSFTAFKAMVALMSNSVMFDMFRMEERRTFHYIHVHDRILEFELPELHTHFQNSGIEAQMYAVDWALTLFTRSLPLPIALRLWDCFVLLGTPFFFQASMGILTLYESRLLAMEPEDITRFLHNLPKTMSSTELFAAIDRVSLSCHDIDVILAGGEDRPWSPESARQISIKFPETYD